MKKLLVTTVLAAAVVFTGIFLGSAAAVAAGAQTPQQAVDQGTASAAGQGFDQHVSVRDRRTGELLAQSLNANDQVASESLVKLFTATHEIVAGFGGYQNVPVAELNALAYMIEYSDDPSENVRFTFSDVPWIVGEYGLSGNTANPSSTEWGATSVTANDESLFLYRVLQDPAVGPWMTAVLAQSQPNGSDGFDQNFGFNALSGGHGSKQGWGSDGFNNEPVTISSIGYTDKYVGAILSTSGNGGGYTQMEAPDSDTAYFIANSSSGTPSVSVSVSAPTSAQNVARNLDSASAVGGRVTVTGWAYDPANTDLSTTVSIYIDGIPSGLVAANEPDAAVNQAYQVTGNHRFAVRLLIGPGRHTIQFAAHALQGSNSAAGFSGAVTVSEPVPLANLARSLDSVSAAGGRVVIRGWAYDPTNPSAATTVSIYIDGKNVALVAANRPDPAGNHIQVAGNHGINIRLLLAPGRHQIVFAAHALPGSSSIPGFSRTLTTGTR